LEWPEARHSEVGGEVGRWRVWQILWSGRGGAAPGVLIPRTGAWSGCGGEQGVRGVRGAPGVRNRHGGLSSPELHAVRFPALLGSWSKTMAVVLLLSARQSHGEVLRGGGVAQLLAYGGAGRQSTALRLGSVRSCERERGAGAGVSWGGLKRIARGSRRRAAGKGSWRSRQLSRALADRGRREKGKGDAD